MKVAILILNYNGKDLLLSYLGSVVAHKQDAEVWVVDNGSTDDSLNVVKKNFPKVKVLVLDKNYGYAKGYNLGRFQNRCGLVLLSQQRCSGELGLGLPHATTL